MRQARFVSEAVEPWRVIAFGDLHVSAKTLDRALEVLRRVRAAASNLEASVVCTGDFWDARGTLNVRQVDALLDEFEQWKNEKIRAVFIPGNHDQVSVNGKIHGIRILDPFPTFSVATEPLFDHDKRIAYLPWRELAEEQSAQFDNLEGSGWTIFGHAEVKGARANGGHEAVGRVTPGQILAHARACYLGHYHKRQCINGGIWYLGSPFEQNFGEMNEPHGLAVISSDKTAPDFIELEDLPKHRRLLLGDSHAQVRPQDIVEVYVKRTDMGSDEVQQYLSRLPAQDIRPLPLKEEDENKPPAFALTLDQAIEAYVAEFEAPLADAEMVSFGRSIVKELPEAATINPLATQVSIKSLTVENFCAVKGEVTVSLDRQGLALIKGPIGAGKTALMDALSWGLYGETAPRKAGSHGATLRADEVINDSSDKCAVEVRLEAGTMWPEIIVRRTKKRGSGAKLTVRGVDSFDGVRDTQTIVNRVVGLDYALWRTCVSLGQGAVGNFVTDADKKRKELLSTAFGLDACPAAVELIRGRLKALRLTADRVRTDLSGSERVLASLQSTDFREQISRWEGQREANKLAAQQAGETAKTTITECDKHLVDEAKWLELKTQHDQRTEALTTQLSQLTGGHRLAELQRDFGAAQAERGLADQKRAQVSAEFSRLEVEFQTNASLTCPSCGRPMDTTHAEKHLAEKGHEATRLTHAMRTFDARIANLTAEIAQLQSSGSDQRIAIETELRQSRDALAQVANALNTFTRLKANKSEAERRLIESRTRWEHESKLVNPFLEEQAKLAKKISDQKESCETLRKSFDELSSQEGVLAFWEVGFGSKGIPVLVLRTVIHELEAHANRFLAQLLGGRVFCQVELSDEDIVVRLFETTLSGEIKERRYEQLSGGQRRCVELAFSPFALSEMIFARCGVRIPLLIVDELTTHLGQDEKPIVCDILRSLNRDTVLVIDHDVSVQAEFDVVFAVGRDAEGATTFARAT